MTTRTIEPRDGAEIYIGAKGHVCIRQRRVYQEATLIFHRDEIPELIEHLQAVYQEALDFVPRPDEEKSDA